jgi:TolB-like protein/DNA-binding winged helix-turn-helix (wHTH) protein
MEGRETAKSRARGSAVIFRFDRFQADDTAFRLIADGAPISLEPKALRLLLYLIENRGRLVRKQELLDVVWADAAVTESALTRSIGLLRKTLEDDSREPRFIETVPTAGYRFIARVETTAAEPSPATVAASESTPPAALPSLRRRYLLRLASIVAACLILLTVTGWLLATRQRATPIRSLAVLPLDNVSGDPDQKYFAAGMTDELTAMLAKDSALRIVSRTSAAQANDSHRSLPEIARVLNVDGIVEGSVSRSNGQVHMTLQLIRADTDAHIWAESYDRAINDAAELPDVAATAIAARLKQAPSSHASTRTINPDAHDAYMRGHYFWVVGRNEDAGKYYRQALDLQPDYALGWTGLADYYAQGALLGELDPRKALPRAQEAAIKAIELDDSLPRAHATLGGMIFLNRGDTVQALKELTRATELDPQDSESIQLHAEVLNALGRYDEAIAVQKQSTGINPFEWAGALSDLYMETRRFDAAIEEGEMRLKDRPADPDILGILADSYHWKGNDRRSVELLGRQLSAEGDSRLSAAVRRAFETGGYQAVVRTELAATEASAKSHRVSTFSLADLHGRLGERDKTLALLEEGVNERDPLELLRIQSDPAFDFVHDSPRYRSCIEKMGLPPMY